MSCVSFTLQGWIELYVYTSGLKLLIIFISSSILLLDWCINDLVFKIKENWEMLPSPWFHGDISNRQLFRLISLFFTPGMQKRGISTAWWHHRICHCFTVSSVHIHDLYKNWKQKISIEFNKMLCPATEPDIFYIYSSYSTLTLCM